MWILDQIGEQDFQDHQTPIFQSEIEVAGRGEPFPFDGTGFGDDPGGTFGSFGYVHHVDADKARGRHAMLILGVYDHDSFAGPEPVQTVRIWFDGVEQDPRPFLGVSQAPSSYSVVVLPIPPELLYDGALTVRVEAIRSGGDGNSGNSIEPDFSQVVVQQDARWPES